MEAYLKKLCFEYQVDEKEVKELLARMEMVYLDKGEYTPNFASYKDGDRLVSAKRCACIESVAL